MGVVLAVQYPAPWKDMLPETRGMMKRMSGRVSGLLDDLSDAMSLPHRHHALARLRAGAHRCPKGSVITGLKVVLRCEFCWLGYVVSLRAWQRATLMAVLLGAKQRVTPQECVPVVGLQSLV